MNSNCLKSIPKDIIKEIFNEYLFHDECKHDFLIELFFSNKLYKINFIQPENKTIEKWMPFSQEIKINIDQFVASNEYDLMMLRFMKHFFIKNLIFSINQNENVFLPNHIDHLQICYPFCHPLNFTLPKQLKKISFGDWYDGSIISQFPNELQEIVFGDNFDSMFPKLPESLIKLQTGTHFNQDLSNILSKNLKELILGERYNRDLNDSLPDYLEVLIFKNSNYNGKITKFPKNLKTLFISYNSSNPLPKLSDGLETLKMSDDFKHKIDYFPPSLKSLNVGVSYCHDINISSLQHLKILDFGFNPHDFNIPQKLPESIEKLILPLSFNREIKSLPKNLKTIILGSKYNKVIKCNLPKSLKSLGFSQHYNQKTSIRSEGIETIQFGKEFNQKIEHLPQSLKILRFGSRFNQKINNLPNGLKTLVFATDFNQKIDNLPDSLEKLVFGKRFNQPLPKLPKNLRHLEFGKSFNQKIDEFPSRIEQVICGNGFNQPLPKDIPKTITILSLGKSYDHIIPSNFEDYFSNSKESSADYFIEKIIKFMTFIFVFLLSIFQ